MIIAYSEGGIVQNNLSGHADGTSYHGTAVLRGTCIPELLQFTRVCKIITTSEFYLLDLMAEGGSKLLLKLFTEMTGGDQRFLVGLPVIQMVEIPAIDQSHGHQGTGDRSAGLSPFRNTRHGCQRFDYLLTVEPELLLQSYKAALGTVVRQLHVVVHLLIQHLHHQVAWHLVVFNQFIAEIVLTRGERASCF